MKVGDYVRTPKGIGKIIKKYSDSKDSFIDLDCGITIDYITKDFTEKEICEMYVKSPNIIDLIEVGDILVIKDFVDEACMIFTDIYLIQNEEQLLHIKNDLEKNKNKMVYSIVTKEQFKNMEYEVK